MSATINEDATNATVNQPGPVGSHVPRDPPQTTKGHQPGQLVGNDKVPESHIQTMKPGTAPASHTFAPNTQNTSIPGQADNPLAVDPETEGQGATSASETLTGATSADVHTGLGHPGAGMTSNELRHDGKSHRAGETHGLQGVGASGAGHSDPSYSSGKRVP